MNQAKTIVADAGPLIGLARIQSLHLLTSLFNEVFVPGEVEQECCRDLSLPGAASIRAALDQEQIQLKSPPQPTALAFPPGLGLGECAVIELAVHLSAPVLMDDRIGRRTAVGKGIAVIGLGGLLQQAKRQNLIPSLKALLSRLRIQRYRLSPDLVQDLLRRAGEAWKEESHSHFEL